MPSGIKSMKTVEKATLCISVLSFVVAFISLALSDSVSSLFKKVEIVAFEESVELTSMVNEKSYLNVVKIINRGRMSSRNIQIIIDYNDKAPEVKASSDERIKSIETIGSSIRVALERLSSGSSLTISMLSDSQLTYKKYYIDDNKKGSIVNALHIKQTSLYDLILLLIVIVSLLVMVWLYKRASEVEFSTRLDRFEREMQKEIRDVRDEIANIEVNDNNGSAKEDSSNSSESEERLSNFLRDEI